MLCQQCNKETNNPKFCGRSCCASFNNRAFPRKRLSKTCANCTNFVLNKRKYCTKCWKTFKSSILGRSEFLKYKLISTKGEECLVCKNKCVIGNYCSEICFLSDRENKLFQTIEDRGWIYEDSKSNTSCKLAKRYLYFKYGEKCSICKLEAMWNDKPLVLILDHIDGRANNWKITNVRLVCPNCDSQLDTYKSKNKNSARKLRHIKYNTKII